jgi:hypothetical protein
MLRDYTERRCCGLRARLDFKTPLLMRAGHLLHCYSPLVEEMGQQTERLSIVEGYLARS